MLPLHSSSLFFLLLNLSLLFSPLGLPLDPCSLSFPSILPIDNSSRYFLTSLSLLLSILLLYPFLPSHLSFSSFLDIVPRYHFSSSLLLNSLINLNLSRLDFHRHSSLNIGIF